MGREKKEIRVVLMLFIAVIAFLGVPGFSSMVNAESEEIWQDSAFVQAVEIFNEENTEDKGWNLDSDTGELKIYCVNGSGTIEDTSYLTEKAEIMSVVIEEGITDIPDGAFEGCIRAESVVIPNSVNTIGGRVFADCDSLTWISIPESVTSIGSPSESAIVSCCNLKSIKYNANLATGRVASDCENLKTVYFGADVKRIPDYFLSGCGITEINLVDSGISSIGNRAFCNCKLENAWIPEQVTHIGDKAFYGNSENFTIHGYDYNGDGASAAKACALENNYVFDSMGLHTWDSNITVNGNIVVRHCLVCDKYSSDKVYEDGENPGYAYGNVVYDYLGRASLNGINKKSTFTISERYVENGYIKLSGNQVTFYEVSSSNTNVVSPVARIDGSYDLKVNHAGKAKITLYALNGTTGIKRYFWVNIRKGLQTVEYKNQIIIEAGTSSFKLGAACTTGTLIYACHSKYLSVSLDGTVTVKSKKTGTYTIEILAKGSQDYATSAVKYCKVKIVPALKLKTKSKNIKKSDLNKSKQRFALKTTSKTYKLRFVPENNKKYFCISKSGKVTVKKGTPKGVYKLAVKVKARKGSISLVKTFHVRVTIK